MKEEEKTVIEEAMAAMVASLKTTPHVEGVVLLVYDGERLLYETSTRTLKIAAALAREAAFAIHDEAVRPEMPEDMKFVNMEAVLETLEPEERDSMRAVMLRMLKDGFPRGARATQTLEPGATTCPGCEEPLRLISAPQYRHESAVAEEAYECTGCGGSLVRTAKVDA